MSSKLTQANFYIENDNGNCIVTLNDEVIAFGMTEAEAEVYVKKCIAASAVCSYYVGTDETSHYRCEG
jgi:hypothetical protein